MSNLSRRRWTSFVALLVPLALASGRATQAQRALFAEPGQGSVPAEEEPLSIAVVLEGTVLEPDGTPAEGAVVLSSAGGKAVADASGSFQLEVRVPLGAESLQVTAAGSGGSSRLASTRIAVPATPGLLRVGSLELALGTSCSPDWIPTFGELPGTTGAILQLTVFDDGSGPALFAAGFFSRAGATPASGIAKWDGSSWSSLDGGANSFVYALATFDDGDGPALYAGGDFTTVGGISATGIARWNGSEWAPLGSGLDGRVEALAVFDDGSGPALFAGGFSSSGARVAKWDGSSWSDLSSGITSHGTPRVLALVPWDDGSGPALYVGGSSISIGASLNIGRWDGASWAGLGSGTGNLVLGVEALAAFDDGGGPALFAGGQFSAMGGVTASHLAKWNGSTWAALGSEVDGAVNALTAFDDGSGPALFVGGQFTTAGGIQAKRIARWNGSSWDALGDGFSGTRVSAFAAFPQGSQTRLCAAGGFHGAGDVGLKNVATWDGSSWAALGSGLPWPVRAMTRFDDGGGPALFLAVAGITGGLVKWTDTGWRLPPERLANYIHALTTFDDGTGTALYAGGSFPVVGSVFASRIARWDGSTWAPLGSGMSGSSEVTVETLTTFDDGTGPALYAGGKFSQAGGVTANNVARWNGSSWSALGTGMNDVVYALATFDDGTGPALYAGGDFTQAGGVFANRVARWNGSSWAPLGTGTTGLGGRVRALATFDDGSGPALYAAGKFSAAGGVPANRIAKWDGTTWAPLGNGLGGFQLAEVYALTAFEDGLGPCLVAAGRFTVAGELFASSIARWNGSTWSTLGSGWPLSAEPVCLLATVDGSGPALYAGGEFVGVPDSGDSYLAKWGCPPDLEPPVLSCPSTVLAGERIGSAPGEIVTFSVTASDLVDPAPVVVCVPPSGSLFPAGRTLVTCTATDASGNEATCQFQVTVARGVR